MIHAYDLSPGSLENADQTSLRITTGGTSLDANRNTVALHSRAKVSAWYVDILLTRCLSDHEAVAGPRYIDHPRHDLETARQGVPALSLTEYLAVSLHGPEASTEGSVGVAIHLQAPSQIAS
jgi:hypothetical protein